MKQALDMCRFHQLTRARGDLIASGTNELSLYPSDMGGERNVPAAVIKFAVAVTILVFSWAVCNSQQRITGVVKSATGSALVGATITKEGSNIGTFTNLD